MEGINPEKKRKSIRLPGVDYSVPGFYFLTICTNVRKNLFGNVIRGDMHLSPCGMVAKQCWEQIPAHFPDVVIDEYIVMPNHVHGILEIVDRGRAQIFVPLQSNTASLHYGPRDDAGVAQKFAPWRQSDEPSFHHVVPRSIGSIVRGFKIGVTKWWRFQKYSGDVWQRNYYEHIIRDDRSLDKIRQYIRDNPWKWSIDRGEETLDMEEILK